MCEPIQSRLIMVPATFSLGIITFSSVWLFLIFAIFAAYFLFWRAGRHELIDSEFLFDVIILSSLGSLLFGRIFDFILRPDIYQWSFRRFVFFNVYGGLSFWGVLLGLTLFGVFFLKSKRVDFWYIFDLVSAPLVFAQSIFYLGILTTKTIPFKNFNLPWVFKASFFSLPVFPQEFYYFIGYFTVFWILKRLATKKRHIGFFASLYLVSISLISLVVAWFGDITFQLSGRSVSQLLIPLAVLVSASVFWYFLAKRKVFEDIKSLFALLLLAVLRLKRMFASIEEAGKFAKSILFFPPYLLRFLYLFLKLLATELIFGLVDFIKIFRDKK